MKIEYYKDHKIVSDPWQDDEGLWHTRVWVYKVVDGHELLVDTIGVVCSTGTPQG